MMSKNVKEKELYNKIAKKIGGYHVAIDKKTEGISGEDNYIKQVKKRLKPWMKVVDIGCADGKFTIQIADLVSKIVGIDISLEMIKVAKENLAQSRKINIDFIEADGSKLPFEPNTFDALISRRGPVSGNPPFLKEAFRVLKLGGITLEITIGEEDMKELVNIFGRGQMFNKKYRVLEHIQKASIKAGFQILHAEEYLYREYFKTIKEVIAFLHAAPVIEDFDEEKDGKYLKRIKEELTTPKGIPFTRHRVVLITRKPLRSSKRFNIGLSTLANFIHRRP